MSIADMLANERAYIAANQDDIATELARNPDKRAEVMSELARTDTFALAMSVTDDAELGRIVREGFWRRMETEAAHECEYRLAERAELFAGPNPINPETNR